MDVSSTEGMTVAEVARGVAAGGRFVVFECVYSVLILSFRTNRVIYLPPGQGMFGKAAGPTLVTLLCGRWGVPWGVVWTLEALMVNLDGGRDVTATVMDSLRKGSAEL